MSKKAGVGFILGGVACLGLAIWTGIAAANNFADGNTMLGVCDAGMAVMMAVMTVGAGFTAASELEEY